MLSKIGVRTVDVGNAMLSMHSIRETAGSHDVQNAIDVSSLLPLVSSVPYNMSVSAFLCIFRRILGYRCVAVPPMMEY